MSGVIGRKTVPVASLINWDKNPRYVKSKEDYQRLKDQIEELGDYKDLVVADDEQTVLGGNSRLRAYKELGKKEIGIVIVDAPDDATKLKYCLSDNDGVGTYNRDELAELIYKTDIGITELEPFSVDMGEPIPVLDIINEVGPPLFEEEKKSRKPRMVTCPSCGEEFEA